MKASIFVVCLMKNIILSGCVMPDILIMERNQILLWKFCMGTQESKLSESARLR